MSAPTNVWFAGSKRERTWLTPFWMAWPICSSVMPSAFAGIGTIGGPAARRLGLGVVAVEGPEVATATGAVAGAVAGAAAKAGAGDGDVDGTDGATSATATRAGAPYGCDVAEARGAAG